MEWRGAHLSQAAEGVRKDGAFFHLFPITMVIYGPYKKFTQDKNRQWEMIVPCSLTPRDNHC